MFLRAALACVLATGCSQSGTHPGVLSAPFDAPTAPLDNGTGLFDVPSSGSPDGPSALPDAGPPVDAGSPIDAPGGHLRVLFIGNSYTYVNDVPGLLRSLAATAGSGPVIDTDQVTVGGAALYDHWTTGTAPMRIAAGPWDAVVIQGQSVEPIASPTSFQYYAQRFAMAATAVHARPVFYATWARAAGDPVYAQSWSGGTPAAMTAGLETAYASLAMATHGGLVPAGIAFQDAQTARPALVLHQADGSHPTLPASYMVACAFYQVLTGVPVPDTSAVPAGVSADDARFLRGIAVQAITEASR